MEWSKLKNCIILLLVCANVFLLLLTGGTAWRSANYDRQAALEAVQALEGAGISFAPAQPPENTALLPLAFQRDREGEEQAARALLGEVEEQDTGGGVRVIYTGAAGSLQFAMDGTFQLELEEGTVTAAGEARRQESQRVLEQLGFEGKLLEAEEEGDTLTLTYRQSWQGTPVFSCTAVLTWRGESLVSVQGRRLAGQTTPQEGEACLDTATVLVRFLSAVSRGGYVFSTVEAMTDGYRVSGGARPEALSPVWLVETDVDDYYIDALTGEVSITDPVG